MSDPATKPKRRSNSYVGLLGVSLLLGIGVGAASALIDAFAGAATMPLQAALMVAATAAVLAICIRWWRNADEAVREAHKWAWYWGGSTGMACVILLFALSTWEVIDVTLPPLGSGPGDLIMTGVALTVGAQGIGYLVAWAAWWLRHR